MWGDKYWDLPVEAPHDDDVTIASEEDRIGMDSGRAAVWKDLDASTNKKTRCVIYFIFNRQAYLNFLPVAVLSFQIWALFERRGQRYSGVT